MNRRDLMLAALAAAGEHASFTPVQVQKLFFLIDREGAQLVGGPHFAFEPYDYGPFDRAVYAELDLLELGGFVRTIATDRYRIYELTPEGYAVGQRLLSGLPGTTRTFLVETANWVRRLSFQQLVAAIYQRYPDMKVNSIFNQ